MRMLPSPLSATSASYLEALQERHRTDPGSIDPSWAHVFNVLHELGAVDSGLQPPGCGDAVAAYRDRGHLAGRLDPLDLGRASLSGRPSPPHVPGRAAGAAGRDRDPGHGALIERFRSFYCGTLGVETAHIDDAAIRDWAYAAVERSDHQHAPEVRRRAFAALTAAEEFERFMAVKYPAKKRFGAEGAETVVPLLDHLLRRAAAAGVTDVLIGTMHRGRLNIAANVLGKPLARLIGEFKGAYPFPSGGARLAADVPYHLGFEAELLLDGRPLRVTLGANPSHLEAVKPVMLGRVRARQDLAAEPGRILGILLHTDASVVAQGVVAETLQLSGVAGFTTAGTVHIVVNNQIGFTTDAEEARTSRYCTGPWKAVDSLVLHANGDDPDAALRAGDLAFDFRQVHGRDAVIDLVCYRRNGHNEIDEPRFTQPLAYRVIDRHPTVGSQYAARLVADGVAVEADEDASRAASQARLRAGFEGADGHRPDHGGPAGGSGASGPVSDPSGSPRRFRSGETALDSTPERDRRTGRRPGAAEPGSVDRGTGVAEPRLRELLLSLSSVPEGFSADRKVERLVRQRAAGVDGPINWALGEALAFATLLAEGTAVRLSGQDVTRGAFSHRHFALTDIETGMRHVSLNHLGVPQARFDVVNSPLSEYAVLGFEYGYSLERPDALVAWEAQFGDFANGAQIVVDQFVASGEEKWLQPSGLVMLLPHGLEGQGPEHSSARIERFLQLAARDNLRVAQPSTPANYFHLLRRQVRSRERKPLVAMTPKWLLRLPAAVSTLADFGPETGFRPLIVSASSDAVRTVLMCSGKVAYDLERTRDERGASDVAILRIEQLYPMPEDALLEVARSCADARFVWVQEEPENMGAWGFLDRRLETLLRKAGVRHPRAGCVCRPESPSPAGSFHGDHDDDQKRLLEQAFGQAAERIRR